MCKVNVPSTTKADDLEPSHAVLTNAMWYSAKHNRKRPKLTPKSNSWIISYPPEFISGGFRGGARGALIFRPNWGPKGRKKFFETAAPLSQGLDDLPLPLSEGLDPPLFMPLLYFTHHFELKVYCHLATKPFRHQEVNSPPTNSRARSLIATK